MWFVVVFDAPALHLEEVLPFDVREDALAVLDRIEGERLTDIYKNGLEVVLLSAKDLDQVKRTHSGYFLTLDQQIDRLEKSTADFREQVFSRRRAAAPA